VSSGVVVNWWNRGRPASALGHSWASGLIVEGLGMVRVMWAVPSGSNVAESCGTA
jgi:hypothetical protein